MDTLVEYYQKMLLALSGVVLAVIGLIGVARGLNHLGFLQKLCWLFRMLGRPRSWVAWVCIVPLTCFLLVMGSEKTGGGSSTNSPSLSAPLRLLHYIQQAITSNDVARGYRISEDTGDGGIVPMPVGAVTNELLRSRGGYDWAFRVEPDGWRFPYRDGFLDGVTVLACGEVRPDIGTLFFPMPLTNGVSLLPETKWGQLPHAEAQRSGEGSVFWHGTTGDGSLLLTWENALVGRDLNAPTNMQMELYRDGSFTWRTDDASQLYLPVFPFDWDNDGLENSVDPEPLVANPIDAHGTNDEWYDIVCSNVFSQVEEPGAVPLQTIDGDVIYFRTNANDRAYYFVDVVAELGPVPIFFTADGISDLGDPIVVALADATNRVPLLLGATYSVTSTVPFSVYTPTNEVVEVTTNSPCDYVIRRPLSITYNDGGENGHFSVDDGGRPNGNIYSTGECCCDLAAAGLPCGGSSCSCNGCTNTYYYGYCGYSLPLGTYSCGCNPEHEPPPATPSGASFSISFSDQAVIFEDGYDNTPDEHVDRQSTQTILTISAQGGQYGGSFELTKVQGFEKLCTHDGGSISPQMSDTIAPGQSYVRSYVCEGLSASGSENDVEIEGSFTEEFTGEELTDKDKVTVVKVELEPVDKPPQNASSSRHIYGIQEKVLLRSRPTSLNVQWSSAISSENGGMLDDAMGYLRCPWEQGSYTVTVEFSDVTYDVDISVFEPRVQCRSASWLRDIPEVSGVSGMVGMSLALYLQPDTVSFSNILIGEIPVLSLDAIPPTGYFALMTGALPATHDVSAGAGIWKTPVFRNNGNYWTDDKAQKASACPQIPGTNPPMWSDGVMRWLIPVGWGWNDGTRFQIEGRCVPDPTDQVYEMDSNGTLTIRKFLHVISRDVDGRIWLDGHRENAWWSGWL